MANVGKGDRYGQQRRRRINNKDVPEQDHDFMLIDGNLSRQPYRYCCHYKGYLTRNQYKIHGCGKRQCVNLKSLEWAIERNK